MEIEPGNQNQVHVTADDKEKMVSCMTTVASMLKENVEVKSDSIAMKKFSAMTTGEIVDLPAPSGETVTAPTLKMKKASKNPPSVAVFTKKTAAAIFPAPVAIKPDTSGVKNAASINITVDSSIVSLVVSLNKS